MNFQEIWIDSIDFIGVAWWVEIMTERPQCTYYFGPFTSSIEADTHKSGYINDLENEGAEGIQVAIERCKPVQLTIEY